MTKLWAERLRNHSILAGARDLSLLQNTETGSTAHPALYSNDTSPLPEHFDVICISYTVPFLIQLLPITT